MLLEQPASRLQAYLLEKFAAYNVSCTGLCLPYSPRGTDGTALYEFGVNGNQVTLDDTVEVQFIIRGTGGGYDPTPTGGSGQNYNAIGRLVVILYTSENAAVDLLEPALTALRGFRMVRFEIEPQTVASRFLFLKEDFNFQRPLVAIEIDVTDRVKNVKCTDLPATVCPPVELYVNGVLHAKIPAGTAFYYVRPGFPYTLPFALA